MSCKNKSTKLDIICLKKKSAIDKIIEKVPKPRGAVPTFGLPKWQAIPLESKIPMVPGPEGAYYFSRQKIGRKLRIDSPDAEFNTSDPFNYEMELQYEGFHDEHLTDFYKRPINIQRMIKLGFVTNHLDAKCSLKDYNMYRKYLKRLHNDSVKKALKKKTERIIEIKDIKFAENEAKKNLERLSKRKHFEKTKEEAEKESWENRLKSKMRNNKNKLNHIEQKRKQDHHDQIAKREEKLKKMKQIHEISAKLERRKLVTILTNRKRKDNERMKMKEIRLIKEKEKRNEFIQNRWKVRQQLQIQELEKENFLKRCIDQERQLFIQEYNERIEKERRRIQKLHENSKKFVKCYIARYISEHKRRICCRIPKSYQRKIKQINSERKNTETIGTKCHQESSNEKNNGDIERRKKSKTGDPKIKKNTSRRKSQKRKQTCEPETNGSIDSNGLFESAMSCLPIIPQDKIKSKCECEQTKFLKQYEHSFINC